MTSQEKWQPSRLIPVSGLSAADEQERRGASALLAVMQSVREYGRSILQLFGAPAGNLETFIEVPFEHNGKTYRPDGLIRVTRGSKSWTALVEVKTLRNHLDENQVQTYLEIAHENGYDAVITVSNELATVGGSHPLVVDKKTLRKVSLHHISWTLIHHEALVEEKNRVVKDPVQAWILSEFVRYLEYPKSGAIDFDDMGPDWVKVRDAAINSTLLAKDPAAHDVSDRFSQLMRFIAMKLSSDLGVQVRRVLSRSDRSDPGTFIQRMATELAATGRMMGTIEVPYAAAPVNITVDLRAGKIFCSIVLTAPANSKPTTRVTWLLKQLKNAPAELMISATGPKARDIGPTVQLVKALERPELILPSTKFDVRTFTLTLAANAGTKRGQGKSSFVDSVLSHVSNFYEHVVQDLKAWVPPAPKVPLNQDTSDSPETNPEVGITDVQMDLLIPNIYAGEQIDNLESNPVVSNGNGWLESSD